MLHPLRLTLLSAALALLLPALAFAAPIGAFVGSYVGETDGTLDGETAPRDLSTTIALTEDGFSVTWTSVVYRRDGRRTEKTYTIEFLPSQRDGIYGSAMKVNVFGKQVPLDPLQGEPFVWARLEDDTLSVFSLIITEDGEYHLQEYHRTLADGGLELLFRRLTRGEQQREVRAYLEKVR